MSGGLDPAAGDGETGSVTWVTACGQYADARSRVRVSK